MNQHMLDRRTFMRRALFAGVGASAMPLLAACGPGDGTATPASPATGEGGRRAATISFATSDRLKVQHMRNRALEFAAARDDLDLSIDVPDPIPDVGETYINSLIAGDPFVNTVDFNVNVFWPQALTGGVYEEHFVDLTDHLAPYEDQVINWPQCKVNGRIYGFPDVPGAVVFYFREDVFEEAGIDPVFQTWDDFIEAGLKLKRDHGAYILPVDDSGFNHFQPFALQAGGGWFDEEQNVILDDPANARALQLMHDFVNVHEIGFKTSEFYGAGVWQAYREDEIVGAYMPDWYGAFQMPGNLDGMKGLWKMAPAPRFDPDGYATAPRGGGVQPILDNEHQDVQLDYMLHAQLDVESNIRRAIEVNYFPVIPEAYEDSRIKELRADFLQQEVGEVLGEVIKNMAPFWTSPYLLQAQDLLASDVVPQGVAGERPVDEILGAAAERLRETAGQ